jgi:uncharacterized membrane protein
MMNTPMSEVKLTESRALAASKIVVPLLTLVGMGISGYLAYEHYLNLAPICPFGAHCDAVLTSPYSQIWGVPLSLLGLLMYAALLLLSLLLWVKKEWSGLLALSIYAFALASLLFTLYLYYLEIFEIQAFCTWCIGSSIVVLLIFIFSIFNLFSLKILKR